MIIANLRERRRANKRSSSPQSNCDRNGSRIKCVLAVPKREKNLRMCERVYVIVGNLSIYYIIGVTYYRHSVASLCLTQTKVRPPLLAVVDVEPLLVLLLFFFCSGGAVAFVWHRNNNNNNNNPTAPLAKKKKKE